MRPVSKNIYPFQHMSLAQPLDQLGKLHARDTGNWDLLTESHMRLGYTIAVRYRFFGANLEEMVSSAMLGIVEAVDRIKRGVLKHDNITGYIVHYIHRYCAEGVRKDRLILTPRGVQGLKRHPLTDNIITVDCELEELYDIIETIMHTDTERDLVFLRQQGYTDTEVATQLCCSRSFVSQTRRELYERFKDAQRRSV